MTYYKLHYINFDNQTNTLRYQVQETWNTMEHIVEVLKVLQH